MKRVNNIYNEIVDLKKINEMYNKRVRKNTKNKQKLEKFENYYVSNITYIKKILEEKSYKPGRYNIFIIKEPKLRLIMSQNMIDKIINHVVSEYFLNNIFDKILIDENIATRKNKGTHYGIKLLKKYLNELKGQDFYILKFDIKKYFFNLDHDIIRELLSKKIKDPDALNILNLIIDSTNQPYVNETIRKLKEKEIEKIIRKNSRDKDRLIKNVQNLPEYKYKKGLPIGNMSSQIIAILYLNELDHYIKEQLKIKYYIRYMDDGILMHQDKKYLEYCLEEIKRILKKYKLELNDKTYIVNIHEGFDFLGFRYYIKNGKLLVKVKNQTKRRFKRKISNLTKLVKEDRVTNQHLIQVKNSYLGHFMYGDTNKLYLNTINNLKEKEDKIEVTHVLIENNSIIYKDERV